jgi:hypothetical protein
MVYYEMGCAVFTLPYSSFFLVWWCDDIPRQEKQGTGDLRAFAWF